MEKAKEQSGSLSMDHGLRGKTVRNKWNVMNDIDKAKLREAGFTMAFMLPVIGLAKHMLIYGRMPLFILAFISLVGCITFPVKKPLKIRILIAGAIWLVVGIIGRQPTHQAVGVGVYIFYVIGLAALLATWLCPLSLKPVVLTVEIAVISLEYVVGHIVLGLIYYLIVTPIGVVLRCAGKDLIDKSLNRDQETYWKNREEPVDRKMYYERQY